MIERGRKRMGSSMDHGTWKVRETEAVHPG